MSFTGHFAACLIGRVWLQNAREQQQQQKKQTKTKQRQKEVQGVKNYY